MNTFRPGQSVREIGKKQIMVIVGQAGLGSTGIFGRIHSTATRQNQIVCKWTNEKGRTKQLSFVSTTLELVE